jgi:outer membrane protein insertion porin family
VKTGDYYSNKEISEGYRKMKETYGVGGYWEAVGFPEFAFSDDPDPAAAGVPAALAAPPTGPPTVDVTLRITEGPQYFVNRITFTGNTTTYDNVVRREMQLLENSIFNTEALKYSVRRINQLGYFRALDENRDITLEKSPNNPNKVDVRVNLEEQNRNQINFGAGVSQFEGFFGQLSFQTANFLGRGESLTISLQSGSRAQNYSLGFTEPFLFERNITGGFNLFRSDIRYIGQFTQRTSGGVLTFGLPLGRGFTRLYTNYSYERVRVTDIAQGFLDPQIQARNPFLRDSLLLTAGGERIISKVSPTLVHNTVDQPIFPTTGKRLTASLDLAGLGGNVSYYKPSLEGVWFWSQNSRLTFGVRGQVEYIGQRAGSAELPIFERLFLGGEFNIRGFDLRTIGPTDPLTNLVLGGNKTLLLNVEESITIAPQVRLIFFFDAGQVRDFGQKFAWTETITERLPIPTPLLVDHRAPTTITLTDPNVPPPTRTFTAAAFKASTGAEVRFFMPVLNVPFRLIFAYDPSRAGILDNSLRPQRAFQFRFAVGTTF